MAFSHVRKAFRPMRRDLPKHTTGFIHQVEFLREKHDQRNHEEIEAEELNEIFCEFFLSVKRKDGKDFEPSSLRGMF